jgi:hypothetical protein
MESLVAVLPAGGAAAAAAAAVGGLLAAAALAGRAGAKNNSSNAPPGQSATVIPRSLVWLMLLQGPDRVLLPDPPGSFSAPLILGVTEDWRNNSFGVSHNRDHFLCAYE